MKRKKINFDEFLKDAEKLRATLCTPERIFEEEAISYGFTEQQAKFLFKFLNKNNGKKLFTF